MIRITLFRKLFFTYFIIIIISLGVMAAVMLSLFKSMYMDEVSQQLTHSARFVKSMVKEISLDNQSLEAKIQGLGGNIQSRITIIDGKGRVMAESESDPERMVNHNDRTEVIQARAKGKGENIRFSQTLSMNMLYLAMPLDPDRPDGAIIRVALPINKINEISNHIYKTAGAAFAILILIALVMGYWLVYRIVKPIREIASAAEAISKGDFSRQLAVKSKDEIGTLSGTINLMSGELGKRFAEINEKTRVLDTVLSNISDGIIAVDKELKITFANSAAGKLLDFEIANSIGKYIWEMARHDEFIRFIKKCAGSGSLKESKTDLVSAASLNLRVYWVAVAEIPDNFMIVVYDITEQHRYEQLRKDFVANVSHELRTPLTFIKGYVETLKEDNIDSVRRKEFFDIIENNVAQLTNLVEDLLEISMMESKAGIARIRQIDLNKLIEKAIDSFKPAITKKTHTITKEITKESLTINADPDLLEKAIANLLDNAIKYTPEKGEIGITAKRTDDGVKIEISDTGIGIPEEDLPRVFERFYRVDKSRSREMGGTGLGLAIVKHIMQLHNGTVSVKSEPGKGTIFSLLLP